MAEIFYARLEGAAGFEKPVVIKRLLPDLAEDQDFVSMFLDEARLAARITHPNVCQVYELGEFEGQYFIAMEYLEGVSVDRLIEKRVYDATAADLRLVAGIFVQACEGLHHAHELCDERGQNIHLVHRDVSPQNLFVTLDGVVKVLDFGIAKARVRSTHTRTGLLKGKYVYMSPEQLNGRPLDRRADIFALGAVLFEMLTGEQAFARETEFLMFRAINQEPRPRVSDLRGDVPPLLDQAVARALSIAPEERFQTAREFGEAVASAVAPLGGPLSMAAIAAEIRRLCGDVVEKRRALIARRLAIITEGEKAAKGDNLAEGARGDSGPTKLASADDEGEERAIPTTAARPLARTKASTPTGVSDASFIQPRRRWVLLLSLGSILLALGLTAFALFASKSPSPSEPQVSRLATDGGTGTPGRDAAPLQPTSAAVATPTMPVAQDAGKTEGGIASKPAPSPGDAGTPSASFPALASHTQPAGNESRANRQGIQNHVPQRGFLTIDSRPYATIYVDGKKIGETPLFRVKVAAGKRKITAVLPSGKSQSFTVTVLPGKDVPPRRLVW